MKNFFIIFINFYQVFFSAILKSILGVNGMCKFSPSCSEYTKRKIQKYGVVAGVFLGIKRLGACK